MWLVLALQYFPSLRPVVHSKKLIVLSGVADAAARPCQTGRWYRWGSLASSRPFGTNVGQRCWLPFSGKETVPLWLGLVLFRCLFFPRAYSVDRGVTITITDRHKRLVRLAEVDSIGRHSFYRCESDVQDMVKISEELLERKWRVVASSA